ncbi:MAG: ribonuclease Z [Flavobacteriales bacterium]|nr:ribonuclease Z [Flavobacteriales bacterium]|tara:strand:+ start:12182 stop:13117 length:936 start_codon:yes stop_codon:yes gene_type:complete
MPFRVTILGSNSAIPTTKRKPTAQLLNVAERFLLIDCGEGTQMQLRKYKIKMQRISHVFISHLHGDHYFGLIGLISTMHLLGRKKELHVYADPQLKEIIMIQLEASKTELAYPLFFHPLDYKNLKLLFEDEKIQVKSFPLKHSIACCGFLVEERQLERRMISEAIMEHKIPVNCIPGIKAGGDFTKSDGTIISHWELTKSAHRARSYAFCSDTAYSEDIVPIIQGVDLLYHEATFKNDLQDRAAYTFHSTTGQAAEIAKLAEVRRLVVGHYSQRYNDLSCLLNEVQEVFPNAELAEEGKIFEILRTYDTNS